MFSCYLCEKETVMIHNFCSECREIKNIMNVYGRENLLDILKTTCLRNKKQIDNKIDLIKKEQGEPPLTRSKKKTDKSI